MHSLFPLTVTDRVHEAASFYRDLFGMVVVADVGWYVQLHHPDHQRVQIAFIEPGHDSVPLVHEGAPSNVLITVEVADVDVVHRLALERDLAMHVTLRNEEWGQRHFITQDPTGLLLDVVQPIEPSPAFLASKGHQSTG